MSLSSADCVRKVGEGRTGTSREGLEVLHPENAKKSSFQLRDGAGVSLSISEKDVNNLPRDNTNFGPCRESEEIGTTGSAEAHVEASSRQDFVNPKQKINISYIGDNRKRQVSFCKRKNGAMKKGRELVGCSV